MSGIVLVTGGAGYIGSHTCLALSRAGYTPVVFDNLSNGHADAVRWGDLHIGDIRNKDRVVEVFEAVKPIAVVHFAGLIEVGRSVSEPIEYYDVNVAGSLNVIEAAASIGKLPFVFSSTCATYGLPRYVPMDESHPQLPINPYGRSKLAVEGMLFDAAAAGKISNVCLRYFNAAGAANEEGIGERHDPETHAIPLILAAVARGDTFKVFGDDYDTRDGTCIRDYIHVMDLAEAHVRAVDYLLNGGKPAAFNLGTGTGTSVLELLREIKTQTGLLPRWENHARRSGDAPELVAETTAARNALGWRPNYGLAEIVKSAAAWHGVLV